MVILMYPEHCIENRSSGRCHSRGYVMRKAGITVSELWLCFVCRDGNLRPNCRAKCLQPQSTQQVVAEVLTVVVKEVVCAHVMNHFVRHFAKVDEFPHVLSHQLCPCIVRDYVH